MPRPRRVFASLRAAEARQRFLADASTVLASSLDTRRVLARLVDLAVPTLADMCTVFLRGADGALRMEAARHRDPTKLEALLEIERAYKRTGDEPYGVSRVSREGVTDWMSEVPANAASLAPDDRQRRLLEEVGFRSYIAVPLLARGQVMGAFTVALGSGAWRRFNEDDVLVVEDLGRRASLALDNAMLFAESRKAEQRARQVMEVTSAFARASTPAEIAEAFFHMGLAPVGATLGAVGRVVDEDFLSVSAFGYTEGLGPVARFHRVPLTELPPVEHAAHSRTSLWFEDSASLAARFPAFARASAAPGAEARVFLPLVVGGRTLGVAWLAWTQPRHFTEDEKQLLESLAWQCAQAFQRALLEEARANAETRYRLATRATKDAVWDLDLRTNQIVWNEALLDAFGWDPREAKLDLAWWEANLHPEDRARVVDDITRAVHSGGPDWHDDYRFRRGDGAWAWVTDRGFIVHDEDGQAVRMVGSMHDETGVQQAKIDREAMLTREMAARADAEAANRLKDEFLATISHELRTPLMAVVGWVQMLRRAPMTLEKQAHALEVIERNARAQEKLIDDLLDVSRIISGKLRLEVAPTDLRRIVDAALSSAGPAAEAKRVNIGVHAPEGADDLPRVFGDATRLQQVVWNLVSNALKFTPAGGRIDVRVSSEEDVVVIEVEDSGQGIPPDLLPHVFERFRQADGTIARRHGGLGLGLAIVKHIVELHGGSVEAESPGEGQGATFRVRLPIATVARRGTPSWLAGRDHGEVVSEVLAAPPGLNGLRVLIVEDEPDTREVLKAMLEEGHAFVIVAADAASGLEALRAEKPDVLLSDIGMPGEDGYAFIHKVRALSAEEGGQVPAIALTAYGRPDDRARAYSAGFNVHLQKPVAPQKLLFTVASAAGRA